MPKGATAGWGSNRGPPVWKSETLTARPRQLLLTYCKTLKVYKLNFVSDNIISLRQTNLHLNHTFDYTGLNGPLT